MRNALRFAFAALAAFAAAGQPRASTEILQIKSVYILPMANGFDQYLANQLTREGVLQVVTDPSKADGVLTDRLGKSFEDRMEELFPSSRDAGAATEENKAQESEPFDMKRVGEQRIQGSGRGKGTVFLVHRASRNVVWSAWEQPKNLRPETLNKTAGRVAARLSEALKLSGASVK